MKNNKMTPGNWCFKGEETSKASETVRDAKGNWLCDCTIGNGKPIAALPDLVNVALELVEYGHQTGWGDLALCGSGDKAIDDKAESIMRNARLALEKAGVL